MTDTELKALVRAGETLTLNDEARAKYDGSYIDLSFGKTHYELKGDGEPVVLVHGYSTPYFIYDKVFARLVELGYKVLRYDLYGRGFSDRPSGRHDVSFFARQLDEITRAVFGDEKFILVGTSMGGAITAAYCREYPGKVKKLILLAPAGMDSFKPPFYMHLCAFPVLGPVLFSIIGDGILIKNTAKELYHCPQEEKDYYIRSFAEGCKYKGFLKCTLSSLRHTIHKTKKATEGYKSVGEQGLPLLVIWGDIDVTMPYYQHERLLEVCPQAELHTFEGYGHTFLFDDGKKTMDVIEDFLAR